MRQLLVALVMVAACIEPPPATPDPGNAPDAGVLPSPDGGSGGGPAACIEAATPPGSGRHNAGANCIGCHTGTGAPLWTVAGTLYSASGAALAGATVVIVDANGKSLSLVSAQNGNFWTSEAVKAPLRVKASRCPSSASMSAGATGSCNSCHAGTGSPGRIVLP